MNIQRCVPIVAALAILGLTYCRTAHAAPTITADPTQVVFYVKSTTMEKSTEITWDAQGAFAPDKTAVYYTTNGAGEMLFANGPKGTMVADFIKLNNAYEFCLWGDHKEKLACTTVTTAYKKVKLDLGFIKDVKVEPRGHSVRITFTTVRSSLPIVQVSKTAPKKIIAINNDDVASFAPGVEVITHLAGGGTVHETIVPNLVPCTDHFFVISASDKKTGLWFKVSGKFHTLCRRVAVTFAKVKVIDDSDDLSAGDLAFGFFINGQNEPNGKPMTFGTHADSGSTKNANVSGSIVKAPATLTLKATGYDDDETEWIPLGPFVVILANTCGTSASDPGIAEGENDCGEWTSGSQSFNLTTLAQNAANPEKFSQSFTIQAHPQGDDSEVSFNVTGTLSVTFVP
jgi:hypothetical protein